ncbi:NYN domain-containing protein [Candidatus Uhrbacteria bacterium]|nr:NYN domain-containing protein [Candidatus Uhrbacteria bacterium]
MILKTEQRVAVFIDTQNMYHSAKHLYGARVNFPGLVEAAVGGRHVIRALAYVAKSKTGEEQAFFDALTQNGIELKIKDVQEFASGAKKADWDVGMTIDAVGIAPHVDVVILVTGDGDFCPLVEYLHAHGVACEVAAFGESTNSRLREIADTFLDLSSEPDTFLIRNGRGRRDAEDQGTSDLEEVQPARVKTNRRRGSDEEGSGLRKIRITY